MRKLSQLEMITLSDLYDRYGDQSFTDAMSCFHGLAELLAENRAPEVEALKQLTKGDSVMNDLRAKVRAF